ncbi:MAG: regulatory protein RecX [Spirochaetia bacterium]|nr:regulatory protein RecX [Spirochaetia bacterium]
MAIIVAIEEGALGTVKAVSEDGSLFLFRPEYLPADTNGSVKRVALVAPLDISDDLLFLAVEATVAEVRAVSLLARAEQFRFGLERKLAAKGISREATKVAIDRLEATGLLSDQRYAESWIRARLRTKIEGPRSLAAALSSRGVDRHAIKQAIEVSLVADDAVAYRYEILTRIANKLGQSSADRKAVRLALSELGWKHGDIDDVLDDMGW